MLSRRFSVAAVSVAVQFCSILTQVSGTSSLWGVFILCKYTSSLVLNDEDDDDDDDDDDVEKEGDVELMLVLV